MSGNHPEKNNDSIDGFNLSKEELMNCFGSQICSQSSDSNYDYQEDYIPSDIQRKNMGQNQPPQLKRELLENNNNSKKLGNYINKDDLLRNICHGFVDMFFSQKEELKGIKEEIKKLQNLMINNNNNNKKSIIKMDKYNNNINNNEGFNYSFKNSKKNIFLNNNNLLVEEQSNQINLPKKENRKENKKDQKKPIIPFLGNSKLYRAKSPNNRANQKSSIPETVLEVEEEYELTSTNKQNKIKEKEKEKQIKKENINNKEYEDPFYQENNNFKFEDINDNEFDEFLKRGKNKDEKKHLPFLGIDPFIKSSDLKNRPNNNLENEDNVLENNNISDNLKEDNNLGIINLESDEIISDFMAGGKKISIKLNDDIRQKINSLDEPLDKLEELDKNKEPSNIMHKTSKLSCNSIMSKGKNINESEERLKELNSKFKPTKRNYNTMLENSKKIMENENPKNEESKKNGSSAKERGLFQKTLKRYGKASYEVSSNLDISSFKNNSNPNSLNNTQSNNRSIKKIKKKIKNKKFMYTTISSCQFYCLCVKKNYNNDDKKCEICKDIGIINNKNFMIGFYFYIIYIKETNKNIEIDTSDSTFKLLKINSLPENDNKFTQFKELEQFFNYQFVLLSYDKYIKLTRESNNSDLHLENLIEEIYDNLIPKYSEVFIKGKRSFLTEICEGDSTLGHMNILLFLMNIDKDFDTKTGEKTIEFSDGYKSCYAFINKGDPINLLLEKVTLRNWINVEIGMSKVLKITEDFKLFIKIYYNSISPTENNDLNSNCPKYGPLLEKKFLPKSILEINNDGGEISLIKIMIIKKYDFYVNNKTKKTRYSRKKFEDEMVKIPDVSSDRKNNNSDSEGKNNNINEIKEPDLLIFNFKAIAMDYEIYNSLKNGINKNIENLLKKKYIIEFSIRYQGLYENIMEGKMYELMFLNLEHKNNNNINHNHNHKISQNSKDNDIQIKYTDKSQINEIQLNLNYKTEKEYIECNEIINKHLNLTNNIDIGKLLIENEENNKQINNDDYLNKEFCFSGIYNGYIDKIRHNLSSEINNEENKIGNEGGTNDEYIERYIFLSFGIQKIAILKLHKEDFFNIDVKSNYIKDKIFNCSDILYKEVLYFDNDNNQPKITGRKKFENSIPLLNLGTNSYSSIILGNYTKNK